MAGEVTKQDQALVRGAQMVAEARNDLEQQLSALRGKLSGIGAQWRGQGAAAFTTVMTRWDDNARRITGALNDYEANMRSSAHTYTASDEQQASTFTSYASRLG